MPPLRASRAAVRCPVPGFLGRWGYPNPGRRLSTPVSFRTTFVSLLSDSACTAREVIDACRRITGRPIPTAAAPRRAGDPAALVADIRKAESELDWHPRISDLDSIVETAWAWLRKRERQGQG
jgi:UDP-glucose 4-epimerase